MGKEMTVPPLIFINTQFFNLKHQYLINISADILMLLSFKIIHKVVPRHEGMLLRVRYNVHVLVKKKNIIIIHVLLLIEDQFGNKPLALPLAFSAILVKQSHFKIYLLTLECKQVIRV
jgi:hypothetical protein